LCTRTKPGIWYSISMVADGGLWLRGVGVEQDGKRSDEYGASELLHAWLDLACVSSDNGRCSEKEMTVERSGLRFALIVSNAFTSNTLSSHLVDLRTVRWHDQKQYSSNAIIPVKSIDYPGSSGLLDC
jgi:hypothetical protein